MFSRRKTFGGIGRAATNAVAERSVRRWIFRASKGLPRPLCLLCGQTEPQRGSVHQLWEPVRLHAKVFGSYFTLKILPNLRIQKISALDLPELAPYRSLKRSAEHAKLGIFVVEGDKVLHRLLASEFTVVSVLLLESRLAEFEPKLRARTEKDIAVFTCARAVMDELVGFEIYQGVLALGKIPGLRSLETILAASPRPHFFAAMDGLSNAENIGVLMRNCVAFGVQALIAGETCSSPFLRRSVRNSMGAVFKLPVLELSHRRDEFHESQTQNPLGTRPSETLAQTLRELRARGVRCIAAHPHTDKKVLSQADFTGDCCVVFGSEGHGISQEVLAACDEAVAIPMANDVDSLNVSAAAAVFLYEVNRQRNGI